MSSSSGFFCLMLSGPGLNADIRNRLLVVAGKMNIERISRLLIKCPYFEGMVSTRFDHKILGEVGGIHFTAELETAFTDRKTTVSFIVPVHHLHEVDLESGIWVDLITGELDLPEKMLGHDRILNN